MCGGRVGPAALERLRGQLLELELDVVRTVAAFRLASSRQLEVLHYLGDGRTPLSAARTARRSVERLTGLQLLARLERRIGGLRAGSAAYVYGLGHVGQRILDDGGLRHRHREPSLAFLDHTLAITDLYVQLVESERRGAVELLEATPEPSSWRSFTAAGGTQSLRPDLFVRVGVQEDELLSFVEVDRGSEHRPAIERKASLYEAYWRTGREEQRHGVFPRVVWIAPDEQRADRLRSVLKVRSSSELYVVTTTGAAMAALAGGTG
jgi:hypothetical protein